MRADRLTAAIVKQIKAGNRPITAAQMAGLTRAEFRTRCRHDPEFARAIELAEGVAEGQAVRMVVESFATDPENAKWWLERGRSGGWSKQVQQLVNGQLEEFMARLEAGLPPDVFRRVLAVATGTPERRLLSAVPPEGDE